MTPERAQSVAISALGWLANNDEELSRFLALSGLGAHELRDHAAEPAFQAGLLAHLTNHEPSLLAFCEMTMIDGAAVRPADVMIAQEVLGGSSAYDRSI
ncbi:MAG: DUF3572 domain-containing protein [Pseudomonadota bacterium]